MFEFVEKVLSDGTSFNYSLIAPQFTTAVAEYNLNSMKTLTQTSMEIYTEKVLNLYTS